MLIVKKKFIFSDKPRTNNHVEAWHGVLAETIDCKHPNVFKFIEEAKKEQALIEGKIAKAEAGLQPPAQKKSGAHYKKNCTHLHQIFTVL